MSKCKIVVLALLIAALMLGSLASCGEKKPGEGPAASETPQTNATPGTEGTDPTPSVPVVDIPIAENGTVLFRITLAPDLAADVSESATSLYEALKKRSNNGAVRISEVNPLTYSAEEPEILIGDTGYAESKAVMNDLSYGDWTVRFSGSKLVVAGFSRDALRTAITRVIQLIKSNADENGTIIVKSDLRLTGTLDEMAVNFTKYDSAAGTYPLVADEGQGTSLAVVRNTNAAEFDAYCRKLSENGYALYASNTIGENRFETYRNDRFLVHVGWYAYENAVRVTIEETRVVPGLANENVYTPASGVTTSVAQFGLATEANHFDHSGMAYVYQLADGSFFVIDGGFSPDAERIYNYMKAKAPGGKIVIAGWLITHNDPDHYRGFVSFAYRYRNDVTFECVIKNMPSAYTYLESGDQEDSSTHAVAAELPGCKVVKAHTGMKFYLRNAEVEILFSIDGFLPAPLKIFNDSSLVFTVTIEGERMLFTGDMGDDVAKLLVPMYGDLLKADALQLAHHGMMNGHGRNMPNLLRFYTKVRPELILWPNSEAQWLNAPGTEDAEQIASFDWNLEAQKSAREVWLAGGDVITVFELPYTPFSGYRFDPENPNPTPVAKSVGSDPATLPYDVANGSVQIDRVSWNTTG